MLGLGKRTTNPMISMLSELLVSGHRATSVDAAISPRSPLDYRIQSPRGLKRYDLGGVGLGIVAALEKPNHNGGHEILAKYAICSAHSNRSDPIPVSAGKNWERIEGCCEGVEMGSSLELENYTYVTIRGPNKESFTKVYYDGGDNKRSGHHQRRCKDLGDGNCGAVFCTPKELPARVADDVTMYPTADLLSSCHWCRKSLHGKDIYMYRGDKAFCTPECRSKQIMIDEKKEQCRSEIARSADVSSSPCSRSPIFSTGILAI